MIERLEVTSARDKARARSLRALGASLRDAYGGGGGSGGGEQAWLGQVWRRRLPPSKGRPRRGRGVWLSGEDGEGSGAHGRGCARLGFPFVSRPNLQL